MLELVRFLVNCKLKAGCCKGGVETPPLLPQTGSEVTFAGAHLWRLLLGRKT